MRTEAEGQSSHAGTHALHVQRSTAIFHASDTSTFDFKFEYLEELPNMPHETPRGLDSSVSRRHLPPSFFTSATFKLEGSHWLLVDAEEEKEKNKQGNRADHWNSLAAPFASRVSAAGVAGVAGVSGALALSVQENMSSLFSPQKAARNSSETRNSSRQGVQVLRGPKLATSVPKLNLKVLQSQKGACHGYTRDNKTALESITEVSESRPSSVTVTALVADKIGVIEQHYEAKRDDKFNATCTANEVSPGNKVASWCIASGNEMPDDALRRPLQGTHWLLNGL